MGTVMAIIGWVMANWAVILEVVGVVFTLGTLITGLTKTPKDDKVWSSVREWVGRILSFVPFKDSEGSLKVPVFQPAKKENKDGFFGG